jgi:hypothetical protein
LRRLQLSLKHEAALTATRVSIGKKKLAYVLVADRRLRYLKGRSCVAYIGTTRKGVSRIARSVARRANDILALRGVRSFHARVITCPPRRNVSTWLKLERALLIGFKEKFGEIPKCNSHGNSMKETDEFRYFRRRGVLRVLDDLS